MKVILRSLGSSQATAALVRQPRNALASSGNNSGSAAAGSPIAGPSRYSSLLFTRSYSDDASWTTKRRATFRPRRDDELALAIEDVDADVDDASPPPTRQPRPAHMAAGHFAPRRELDLKTKAYILRTWRYDPDVTDERSLRKRYPYLPMRALRAIINQDGEGFEEDDSLVDADVDEELRAMQELGLEDGDDLFADVGELEPGEEREAAERELKEARRGWAKQGFLRRPMPFDVKDPMMPAFLEAKLAERRRRTEDKFLPPRDGLEPLTHAQRPRGPSLNDKHSRRAPRPRGPSFNDKHSPVNTPPPRRQVGPSAVLAHLREAKHRDQRQQADGAMHTPSKQPWAPRTTSGKKGAAGASSSSSG